MHVVLLYVSSIAPAGYKQDGRSRQLAEFQALTMAPSSSAKQLIAVAGAAFLLAAESGRPQPVHLRLYMHDVMRGPGTTAIHLIHGVGPPHDVERGAYFGDTVAIEHIALPRITDAREQHQYCKKGSKIEPSRKASRFQVCRSQTS